LKDGRLEEFWFFFDFFSVRPAAVPRPFQGKEGCRMRKIFPLESDAYLQHLLRCNEVIGDCLGLPIRNAKDLEKAFKCLQEGPWPLDAPVKAQYYQEEFPWLAKLFDPDQPETRVPVWEQAAEDLFEHPSYKAWLYRLAKRYVDQHCPREPLPRGQGKQPPETPGDRAVKALGGVLWRAFLIVVGKAAYCLEQRKVQPEKTRASASPVA
jgi:hypothetical protein